MSVYGLILDVDGVIVDTEAVNVEVSIKVFAELFGVRVRPVDFEAGLGRGAQEYMLAAARVHGLELSESQVDKASQLRQDNFLQLLKERPLPAFPGVLELIRGAMARDDFRVAIATSSTREKSEAALRSAKVPYEQLVYITGSEVKNKKPHPELFQQAVERLSVSAKRCVVIEDAPNGVQAAKAAGCKCVAVTNSTTAENLARADLIVDSLEKVDVAILMNIVEGI